MYSILKCVIDTTNYGNKNVDFLFSAHNTILEYPSSGMLEVKILGSQIIYICLGARKPEDVNMISRIGWG